jgi:hypothetical protein
VVALKFEIVSRLKVDPKALARAEESCEAQRRISADPTLAVNDFVDSTWRDVDQYREAVLRYAKRLKKVQQQNFARMYRCNFARHESFFQL